MEKKPKITPIGQDYEYKEDGTLYAVEYKQDKSGNAYLGKTTKGIVNSWANSFTAVTPTMAFAVDTSALSYYSTDSFDKDIAAHVSANNRYTLDNSIAKEELKEALLQALNESNMSVDMRRQADKKEQTIVQVGNRTITDAVTTQQRANGYVFAR